ncbi:MAG: NAD(P)-dependent oxidoreductase [Deltaproteobacteria bacterium]|nr:NAD(P)-dependent oxidoreductase [Deltaproteobacteria bacterium]
MGPKVGFMGLGIMGAAMAANIHRAGFPLMVYNRSADKSEKFAEMGVGVASSPKSLAHATDIVILMVTGPEAVDGLLFGPEGAAQSLNKKKTLINMSSVSPAYTRDLAQRLAPTGCAFIDAPVSGTKKPAEEGTLIILAGGDKARIDEVTPILKTMGKKVVYCGETGLGSMMKMTINLLLGLMMAGLGETVQYGLKGGLRLEDILEVILSGPLSCGLYQVKSEMLKDDDYPAQFPLKHMTKDAKFIVDTAYDTGAPAPLGHLLLHLFRLGVSQGLGDADFAAIAKVMENLGHG